MTDYISREAAISHPFANGQYDREHASKDFIMGYESYKEWLEALPPPMSSPWYAANGYGNLTNVAGNATNAAKRPRTLA